MSKIAKNIVDLSSYDATQHTPGANVLKRLLWYWVNAFVFDSWLCPLYGLKRQILHTFGAEIGRGVVIKPRVNIKYPWKLSVGDYSWIGEGVWVDNIECVQIGNHCCVSQGVYLCTGNHNWSDRRFGLVARRITIGSQSWIGAFSIICPAVSVAEGTVITAGSMVTQDTVPWTVYAGNPASVMKDREISDTVPSFDIQLSGGSAEAQ